MPWVTSAALQKQHRNASDPQVMSRIDAVLFSQLIKQFALKWATQDRRAMQHAVIFEIHRPTGVVHFTSLRV